MTTAGQTKHLKKAFLAAFREAGIIRRACDQVGVGRTTVYRWLEQDTDFAAEYEHAETESTEMLEAAALSRAVEGVTKLSASGKPYTDYSDTLLIFLLKARKPTVYRDRVQLQHADAAGDLLEQEGSGRRMIEVRTVDYRQSVRPLLTGGDDAERD